MDETDDKVGKTMALGVKEADWFLAKKDGSGRRWTPAGENLIKPFLTDKAWSSLLLRAEAAATRKSVL